MRKAEAKTKAWDLLAIQDADPWGKPYKIMTSKLKKSDPSICESLPPADVKNIIKHLFPDYPTIKKQSIQFEWNEEYEITEDDIVRSIKRISNNKVPDPNGINGKVIKWT